MRHQLSASDHGSRAEQSDVRSWKRPALQRKLRLAIGVTTILFGVGAGLAFSHADNDQFVPRFQEFSDPEGRFANFNPGGPTDTSSNAFFQDLGTNGRQCVTCHQASDAWSVTPPHIQARFNATHGTDPIFRPVDGANCPTADVSTLEERREAYSLLLTKGLIRN
jgi:cytochrome c peroxidase